MRNVDVTIVLPMYNEKERILQCVQAVENAVSSITKSFRIIIAEDGSNDGTEKLAMEIAKSRPNIIHLHTDQRLGRGAALKNALINYQAEVTVYMDADLAADLTHLCDLIKMTRESGGIVIGSRYAKGAQVNNRPIVRTIASIAYNNLIRILFNDGTRDHQCGLKAFDKKLIDDVLEEVQATGWFWDTEIIIRSQKKGYPVIEMPIRWLEPRSRGESKVNLLSDSYEMGKSLLQLWLRFNFRKALQMINRKIEDRG